MSRRMRVRDPEYRLIGRGPHAAPGGATHYVVFDRPEWKTPTAGQLEKFERDAAIVRAHGGRMLRQPHEVAGRTKPFSVRDVRRCRQATRRDLPDWEIVASWNGVGCHSLSLGIKKRRAGEVTA